MFLIFFCKTYTVVNTKIEIFNSEPSLMVSMVFLAVYGFKGFFCMFSIVHFIFSIYTVCVFVCTLVVNVNNIIISILESKLIVFSKKKMIVK